MILADSKKHKANQINEESDIKENHVDRQIEIEPEKRAALEPQPQERQRERERIGVRESQRERNTEL